MIERGTLPQEFLENILTAHLDSRFLASLFHGDVTL